MQKLKAKNPCLQNRKRKRGTSNLVNEEKFNMSNKSRPNETETEARLAHSRAVCLPADGYRACGCDWRRPVDKCGIPSTKRREEELAKRSSDVCLLTSLPLIYRTFAKGLLWQRQSQISRKWILASSRFVTNHDVRGLFKS
jgi:hypothetical protein